ncbi:hypothetical protein OIU19_03025 [Pseudomonas sp. BT-42-2]|uniref:hypothetical protein n=1 Tax=Pseudomonas sp. BT-42-2 TaxID=2986927 RepID=UPI0021F7C975|nr:hypothetical protein [Pseudomonas sp. BT-42-2]MCV9917753.1 hypothetical protein [Pseudomonas sp. BT-42-2]
MPEIKCDYGHTQRIGTDEWISQMSLDQIRYAHQQMAEKIQKVETGPRRTVWLVDDGITIAGFYREEAAEEAADHLLQIFKEVFLREVKDFTGAHGSIHEFKQSLPHIEPRRVTQFEYDNEWFPAKS